MAYTSFQQLSDGLFRSDNGDEDVRLAEMVTTTMVPYEGPVYTAYDVSIGDRQAEIKKDDGISLEFWLITIIGLRFDSDFIDISFARL